MDGLTIGRIVHYVLTDEERVHDVMNAHRAAIVTNAWPTTSADTVLANLHVFYDGANDKPKAQPSAPNNPAWHSSILYSATKEPGTWHWIERA